MTRLSRILRRLSSVALVLGAVAWAGSASAQFFGVNADVAISYAATNVTPKSVSGGSVGITHPIPMIPNIGVTALSFLETETSSVTSPSSSKLTLTTKVKLQTINFFYHIPFPIVTMAVGAGSTTEDLSDNGNVAEGYIHIGLPFYNMLEFHLGYHLLSAPKLDRLKGTNKDYSSHTASNIEQKKSYSGGMTTVGLQIAF